MSIPKLLSGCVTILFSLLLAAANFSQDNQSPDQKPRNVKKEPAKVFKEWPKKDVAPIITPEELNAYEKLATDEEREQFIGIFWKQRDSDPDTEENEYKEAYYERLAYANEHFTSGKPGSLTDRGRIYIKFGKPDEIESHPAGGPYERTPAEGGGSTNTYPFERWFYRHIPGVSNGIDLEFVDPSGTGEYRLAKNPDEKDAMLLVPGAGRTLDEIAGNITRADRIAGLGSPGLRNYRSEQYSPFSVSDLHARLEQVPEVKRTYFGGGLTGTPKIDDSPLHFEIHADFFRQSDNQVLTAFTIQAENRDLSFADSGGVQTARLNIFGRVMTVAARRLGEFEDSVTTSATVAELTEAKERKSAYSKAVILPPGRYRLDVLVRDVVSGAEGLRHYAFVVPRYEPNVLATSSIVLAEKLESVEGQRGGGPFVIGQTKVIPNLTASYRHGQPVGIYMQVYNAAIDQTTLKPSVDAEYVLLKDGKELNNQVEDWREMSDAGQRLTLARLIDTRSLAPGQYEIVIRIRDRVTGQTMSPSARFRLER